MIKCYCEHWRVRINVTKTVYNVYANHNDVLQKNLKIEVGGRSLKRADLPSYKAVLLDPRLRLTQHIEKSAVKASERVALMKKLAGVKWGASRYPLQTIYFTLMRQVQALSYL